MNTSKRLYKSDEPVFAGVCGGIAEYFELDPTLIRILTVIFVLAGFGLPLIAYIIAMIVMPKRSGNYPDYIDVKPTASQTYATTTDTSTASTGATNTNTNTTRASANASAAQTAGTTGFAQSTNPHNPTGSAGSPYPYSSSNPAATATTANAAANTTTSTTASTTANAAAAGPNPNPNPNPTANTNPNPNPAPSAHTAWASTEATAAPGRAYTTCNPQAYDAVDSSHQSAPGKRPWYSIRTSVMLGILLVGIGIFALLGTFLNISILSFWPMFIIVMGFMMLCTPGHRGWSLARAGNAIAVIAIGFALQLWTFDVISTKTFVLTFVHLWPVLLVVLGLSIIGGATKQGVFGLFGSLLLSATLLFGIWNFGQINAPLYIDGPGDLDFQITVPAPPLDLSLSRDDPWSIRR
jgi:phage shock protein PspC (stress-responsive transcriptional regulator)